MRGYAGFEKLTKIDRDNLCDIAWFLKGLKISKESPFGEDHDETLRKLCMSIADKVDEDNRQAKLPGCGVPRPQEQ